MVGFIMSIYKIIFAFIIFCFFQTTPSISIEVKIPKIGDLKKITEDIKKEIEKKEPEVKKEEVKKEEVKTEEAKTEETKTEEAKTEEVGSFEGIKIVHINAMYEPILNLEYDIKKGTGLINIEPPKKYADQVVSFDFKILYNHLEDLEKDSNKYDVMKFITKHDQSIKDGLTKFEFDDGKTYKVRREPIIKDPERLNAQISYFKGEKEITSTWQGQTDTFNLCDVVYCEELEFLNDENGYLGKFPKESNYRKVSNQSGLTTSDLFRNLWRNGIIASYDKRTGIVKKKDHVFDGEIIRLNDQEPFVFRISLRNENIHHRKIEKFRDFIGNEIHLKVNEKKLPYSPSSLYDDTTKKWIITYYDLNRSQAVPAINNPLFAGRFTIEVFEMKERVFSNIDPIWSIGGFYFFYKQ